MIKNIFKPFISIFIIFTIFIISQIFHAGANAFAAGDIFELAPLNIYAATQSRSRLNSSQDSFILEVDEELSWRNISLAEIASGIPFIYSPSAGGPGAIASPSINGGSASQTLILIDGRPVNSPALGSFNLNLLPVEAFGRMEAFFGPASSRYGINGLSGALNLSGAHATQEKNSSTLRTVFSSYGNFEQSLKSIFTNGRPGNKHELFLKRHIYGGYRPNSDFKADYLGYNNNFRAGEKVEGYFSFFHAATRNGAPGVMPGENDAAPEFGGPESYSHFDRQADALYFTNLDLKYSISDDCNLSVKVFNDLQSSYFNTRYKDWLSGALILNAGESKTTRTGSYINYSQQTSHASFKTGLNRVKNTLASRNSEFNATASINLSPVENSPQSASNSIWTSYRTTGAKFSFDFSFNHDRPDFFSPANSYSAGASKKLGRAGKIKFFHAAGYRSPTLNDLFYPGAGNPFLKPEHATFNSISIEKNAHGTKSEIRLFSKRTSDMIEWFPAPSDPSGFRWTPQNINSFYGKGISLSFDKKLSARINAGIYYENARYRQKNMEEIYNDFAGLQKFETIERAARQLPQNRASIKIYGNLSQRLAFNFSNTLTSKIKFYYADYNGAPIVTMNEKTIDANIISDISFYYDCAKNTRIDFAVENLFNKNYARRFGSTISDRNYPMPGRNCKIVFNKFY